MANTIQPFGFWQASGNGSAPTYEQVAMSIKSNNSTPIFFGDPIAQVAGTTGIGTGYISQAPAPVAVTIASGSLAAGVLTLTFTAISPAPPVGSYITVYGGTSTAGTANGTWLVTASSTTTVSFNFPGAYTTGTASGYIWTPIAGIFVGCSYLSTSQKKRVWPNYWPGSDASSDVTAYVIADPAAQFLVQTANSNTTSTAVSFASVGQNIGFNFAVNGASPASSNGNTANGLSTYFADQYTLAANFPAGYPGQPYLPFRIIRLSNTGAGGAASPLSGINGNDPSTAGNNIVVGFNLATFGQLSGI